VGGRPLDCYHVKIRKDEKGGACYRHGREAEDSVFVRKSEETVLQDPGTGRVSGKIDRKEIIPAGVYLDVLVKERDHYRALENTVVQILGSVTCGVWG
jgi:hypothetical protein